MSSLEYSKVLLRNYDDLIRLRSGILDESEKLYYISIIDETKDYPKESLKDHHRYYRYKQSNKLEVYKKDRHSHFFNGEKPYFPLEKKNQTQANFFKGKEIIVTTDYSFIANNKPMITMCIIDNINEGIDCYLFWTSTLPMLETMKKSASFIITPILTTLYQIIENESIDTINTFFISSYEQIKQQSLIKLCSYLVRPFINHKIENFETFEFVHSKYLLTNFVRHELYRSIIDAGFTPYKKMTEDEINTIEQRTYKKRESFPYMTIDDPVCIWHNFNISDVIHVVTLFIKGVRNDYRYVIKYENIPGKRILIKFKDINSILVEQKKTNTHTSMTTTNDSSSIKSDSDDLYSELSEEEEETEEEYESEDETEDE